MNMHDILHIMAGCAIGMLISQALHTAMIHKIMTSMIEGIVQGLMSGIKKMQPKSIYDPDEV